MKRYHDYRQMTDFTDGEKVDPEFLDRVNISRYVSSDYSVDGNHRSPKARTGSRSTGQRPGFKKRPRRNSKQ